MRVIGSHDISLTRTFRSEGAWTSVAISPSSLCVVARLVTGRQRAPPAPPLRLAVVLRLDVPPPRGADDRADREALEVRGDATPPVLVHEGHVLVREARHRAGHADPADVRTPADAVHPATDRHVALDDRALAAELHEAAVVVAVLGGEVALLREAAAVAVLPCRA